MFELLLVCMSFRWEKMASRLEYGTGFLVLMKGWHVCLSIPNPIKLCLNNWLALILSHAVRQTSLIGRPNCRMYVLFCSKIVAVKFFKLVCLLCCATKTIINHKLSQLFSVNKHNFGLVSWRIIQRFFCEI